MAGERDTIFAPATARGASAVAVVRVSGRGADAALTRLVGRLPEARRASLRMVRDPESGEILDEALVLRFEAEASFTGENSFEIQCHGGSASVSAVLRALSVCDGLRLAEPGEFTRRALEAGRLDLTQAEALADLVSAETEAQRRQAFRAMRGALGEAAERWRSSLVRARALLEATIDFADEEVPEDVSPEVLSLLRSVGGEMGAELGGASAAARVREGFEVAILGPPNAGKSTLLNAIARRDVAITSDRPGTTRDVLEVSVDLQGLPATFLDTAGLRETDDEVERLGMDRARRRAAEADVRIWLSESGEWPDAENGDLCVLAKRDDGGDELCVSGRTGFGVAALLDLVADRLAQVASSAGDLTRERHRRAVSDALLELIRAEALAVEGETYELAAEHLRQACGASEVLIGRVDPERGLEDISASFRVGKRACVT